MSFSNSEKTDGANHIKEVHTGDGCLCKRLGCREGNHRCEPIVATVTLGDDIEYGRVRIQGKDAHGNGIADNLVFTDENKSDAQTTTRYFAEVTKVTSSGWAGGAFDVKGRDKAARITIKPQDEEIVVLWNGEVTRGIIPEVMDDMLMTQLTIAISREEVMRYACVFTFRDSVHQMNFGGDTGETARKSDASALEFPVDDLFIGLQAEITIDGVRLAITEATLVINQQYTPSNVISGEPTDEALPSGGTRLVTLTGNVRYATQNDLNENFRENIKFKNIQIRFFNKLKGGFPGQLRIRGCEGRTQPKPCPDAFRYG